jgi:hypothetical protein
MSTPIQTALTEVYLAAQLLPEEQTMKKKKKKNSDMHSRNSKTNSFQRRRAEFRTNVKSSIFVLKYLLLF